MEQQAQTDDSGFSIAVNKCPGNTESLAFRKIVQPLGYDAFGHRLRKMTISNENHLVVQIVRSGKNLAFKTTTWFMSATKKPALVQKDHLVFATTRPELAQLMPGPA